MTDTAAWEARWAAVRELLTNAVMPVADHYLPSCSYGGRLTVKRTCD